MIAACVYVSTREGEGVQTGEYRKTVGVGANERGSERGGSQERGRDER
jgi:hypothetical protein